VLPRKAVVERKLKSKKRHVAVRHSSSLAGTYKKERRVAIVQSLQQIHDYFLSKPHRIVRWGFAISLVGMTLLACGLFGRLLMIVLPGKAKPPKNLDVLLPYFPTWWIPETWFGYFCAVMIALTGLIVYGVGRRMATLVK
jgi:hypothetical protein